MWADVLILHVNFGVDDWSHQNRPMQTSQALKKGGREGEKGKGREMGERVQNEYLKKKKGVK